MSTKLNKAFLAILFLILIGCEQSIESDKIKRINGLYVYAGSGEPLDGKYRCATPIGGTYDGDHVSTFEYDDGIPVGEWTYTFNGDPIHSGKYVKEPTIQADLQTITDSKRVDLDLWEEGGYSMLTIDLVQPQNTDSVSLKELEKTLKDKLLKRHECKIVFVESVTDQEEKRLFEMNLE
ncbi:MAG: hypothetical protein WA960_11580 [Tunicatimonas sp.]